MFRLAAASVALFLSLVPGDAHAQARGPLLENAPRIDAEIHGVLTIEGPPTLVPEAGFRSAAVPIRLNRDKLLKMSPGQQVRIALPDDIAHDYVFELAEAHGGGIHTWIGRHRDRGNHNRTIITTGPAGSFGVVSTPEGEFRIVPGEGHDWLVDMTAEQAHIPIELGGDDGRIPPGTPKSSPWHQPGIFVPMDGVNSLPVPKAMPTPTNEVDLMIVYTRGLANALGANLMTRLHFLVTRANTAYVDSEIAIRLRLVSAVMVDYADTGSNNTALDAISPATSGFNSAAFGSIEGLRNTYGADVVALLRNGNAFGGSGVAWVGGIGGNWDSRYMYSVTTGCTQGCESVFIHEVGHNMGNKHDRPTAQWQAGGTPTASPGAFNYSFGFAYCGGNRGINCDPTIANSLTGGCGTSQPECGLYSSSGGTANHADSFAEIMAYFHGSTARVYKFSNPSITCAAPSGTPQPCGVSEASAGSANTALSMNNSRAAIAALKPTVVASGTTPGSLQFTSSAFAVSESGGTASVTVSRLGGTSGTVSVSYATSNGSATAGADYTAAAGSLTWTDGDSANKTISITILNDSLTEGAETFTVTLSGPTGGAFIGSPGAASVLITEPWPAAGAMPAGFTSADGSWTVATDQVYEGTHSLRSGQAISSNLGTFNNSDLEFSGNFQAGTVAFAYRVSSWAVPGFTQYGVFEFSIDGAVQVSDAGETGWKFVALPITAGTHTLRWRFKNALTAPCNAGWNPPAPGGSNCADRTWIDAVALPLALSTAATTLASSPNPSTSGQTVTFTATVSGSSGTPTGTVAFSNGSTAISGCSARTLSSGTATCTVSTLSAGTHSITAAYSGDTNYRAGSSATLSQVVTAGAQLFSPSPGTLDFGGQSINTTSGTLTTTLTNTHGASISNITVTAPTGFSVVSNTCNGTLAVNATCQVGLAFTPGSQGSLGNTLTITYSAGTTVVVLLGVGERSLVTHYYRSILRRAPDGGGKGFWEGEAARVQGLGANVNEVWFAMAQSFFSSAEYLAQNRNNLGYVTDLYNTFFNRAPDPAGLAYWEGQLNQGMPREVVLAAYMFSAEFDQFTRAVFGTTTVRREVDTVVDFYRGLLARLPDSTGFNFWLGRFRAAQCSGAAAVIAEVESISSSFATSGEYGARGRSNAQYVGDLYNAFLRRGGDLTGVQFWINQIATGARTREAVRREFIASAEFQARVQGILQESCIR